MLTEAVISDNQQEATRKPKVRHELGNRVGTCSDGGTQACPVQNKPPPLQGVREVPDLRSPDLNVGVRFTPPEAGFFWPSQISGRNVVKSPVIAMLFARECAEN